MGSTGSRKQPHKVYRINGQYGFSGAHCFGRRAQARKHIEPRILTWSGVREDILGEVGGVKWEKCGRVTLGRGERLILRSERGTVGLIEGVQGRGKEMSLQRERQQPEP